MAELWATTVVIGFLAVCGWTGFYILAKNIEAGFMSHNQPSSGGSHDSLRNGRKPRAND